MTIDNTNGSEGTVAAIDGVQERAAYQTVHDMASDDSLSVSVVEAVAEAKGSDPLDLRETLYEVVDPDALDRLFPVDPHGTSWTDGRVTLNLCDCRVVIQGTGLIRVFNTNY